MLKRAGLVPLVAAIAATATFFHRVVFGDGIFSARDIQRVYYPLKAYWAARVSQGELPQWYPSDGLGQSFIGMVISGTFHPFNLLYLALRLESALMVSVLLSFLAAFLGAFALVRRFTSGRGPALVAGVLFAFNGYLVGITNNLLYLLAAATVPWALWAVDRVIDEPSVGRVGPAAGFLALILLSGDAQSFLVTCGLVPLVLVLRHRPGHARRELFAACAVLALAALVSAIQILPALASLPQSMIAHQPLSSVLTWSMHPARLLELGIGPIFASEPNLPIASEIARSLLQTDTDQLWVESVHLGLPALVLAAMAVLAHRTDRRLWAGLAVLSVLVVLALGKHAGLYALMHRLAPLWENFRYPEKLLPFVLLGLALLAGAGFEVVQRDAAHRRTAVFATLGLGALSFVIAATAGPLTRAMSTLTDATLQHVSSNTMTAALNSGGAMVLLAVVLTAVRSDAARAALVPTLMFAALFVANEPTYVLTSNEVLHSPTPFVQAIAQREGPAHLGAARVFGASDAYAVPRLPNVSYADAYTVALWSSLTAATPAHFGLEGANAYLPAASLRARRLADRVPTCPTCASAMGVRYVAYSAARGPVAILPGMTEVAAEPRFKLHLLSIDQTAERAFLVDRHCVGTPEQALRVVTSREFNPATQTVAECEPTEPSVEQDTPGTAQIISYDPERVEIRAQSLRPALLVLTDATAPGWEALIDGRPAQILVANYAVRAVDVPAGDHRVVFSYRTPLLHTGFALSAGGIAVWVIALILARRKRSPLLCE